MTRQDVDKTGPEFEFVDPTAGAIVYLEHGYPDPRVRWHFHNEYELHYIVASSGKVFVGDYIGQFRPGNLVLTGPRLPHNWISNLDSVSQYDLRDMVVQFEHDAIEGVAGLMPEFRELIPLLEEARRGIQFLDMEHRADHYMPAIRESWGPMRLGYFCQFMHELAGCQNRKTLSSVAFESTVDAVGLDRVNTVVNYVLSHYREKISLGHVAEMVGMNVSYFSRFFKKSTGLAFNDFVTQIRISKACELLSTSDQQITTICYDVGYNNVANFNRRFLERKKLTPREYRNQAQLRLTREGAGDLQSRQELSS